MVVSRALALTLLCLAASSTVSWAQEGSDAAAAAADNYWRDLESEVVALRAQVVEESSAKAAHVKRTADLEAELVTLSQRVQQQEGKLVAAETKLHEAKEQLKAAPKVAAPSVVSSGEEAWLPLWLQRRIDNAGEDAHVLIQELKAGNTSRYGKLALDTYLLTQQKALALQALLSAELDTRAPGVKVKLSELCEAARPHVIKARQVLDTYVIQAKWPRQLVEQVVHLEVELRSVLTKVLRSNPALAPYADPVYIQVAVYVLLTLPLLLVILPIVSVLLAPRRSSVSEAAAAAAKKKQGGSSAKKGGASKAGKVASAGVARPAAATTKAAAK